MRRDKIDVSLVFEDSKFRKYYRFNPCLSWFDTNKRSGLSQSKHLCFGMVVLIVIGWMRVDNHHPIDVVHVREHGNAHLVGHELCMAMLVLIRDKRVKQFQCETGICYAVC